MCVEHKIKRGAKLMKKSLYKIAVCATAAALIATSATGCSNTTNASESSSADSSSSTENQTLEVAAFEGGYGRTYFDDLIAAFEEANPGVKVTLTCSPKIDDVIQPRIVAGNPPDVLMSFGASRIGQMATEGDLLDLTDIFNEPAPGQTDNLKDTIVDGLIDTVCTPNKDGKIYLAPTDQGAQGLYYNKTLFETNGWKAPETWDEFFALGDEAKAQGISLFTYQGMYPGYLEAMLMPAIASTAGMDAFNKILNYDEGAWKDANVQKAMDVFTKIANEDYLMPGTVAMNHTQAQTAFIQGKALFIPCGSWLANEMKDAIPDSGFSFGFIPAPTFNATDTHYVVGSCGYNVVPAKAKNPELAKKFIQFTYTDDMVKLLAEKNTSIMPVKGTMEKVKDVVPEAVYNTFKAYDTAECLLSDWAPTPTTEVKISDEIYNPISSIMNKTMTTEQWSDSIETADAKLRDAIAKQ